MNFRSNCSFVLPTLTLPIPSLNLPPIPELPWFDVSIPGFALDLKLPTIALPIPSLSLPEIPSLPFFSVSIPGFALDLNLPTLALPIPSLALPSLPWPDFPPKIKCPLDRS